MSLSSQAGNASTNINKSKLKLSFPQQGVQSLHYCKMQGKNGYESYPSKQGNCAQITWRSRIAEKGALNNKMSKERVKSVQICRN